jgi:hypothetical protein
MPIAVMGLVTRPCLSFRPPDLGVDQSRITARGRLGEP